MRLIYTTYWTRKNLRTELDYYNWLNSVEDNDLVVRQEFVLPGKGLLSMGIECWRFTLARIHGERIYDWDTHPINREKGWQCWSGNKDEWGDVFPARLVPNHSDFGLTEEGDSVIGHKPVYEPLFINNDRFVYLVSKGEKFNQRRSQVRNAYPRSYIVECNEGELIYCFAKEKQEIEEEGIKYLYSEYLDYT